MTLLMLICAKRSIQKVSYQIIYVFVNVSVDKLILQRNKLYCNFCVNESGYFYIRKIKFIIEICFNTLLGSKHLIFCGDYKCLSHVNFNLKKRLVIFITSNNYKKLSLWYLRTPFTLLRYMFVTRFSS